MFQEIVKRTLRVPIDKKNSTGDSTPLVSGLDSILISNGFKLSPDLFAAMSALDAEDCLFVGKAVLQAAKKLIGAHRKHNTYFKNFPEGVPDTFAFWCECIIDALATPKLSGLIQLELSFGTVNLLDLPKYGRYLHTYEDMVAVHEAFTGNAGKHIRVLQLGGTLAEETEKLYHSLAGSNIPLSESDRELLTQLAKVCVDGNQPESIPMKENLAIINTARIKADAPIIVNTVTDVLRLACHLSGGDVTLAVNTRFKSFPRAYRRNILAALDRIARFNPEKLADVNVYSEQWKRLFERLHPWEHKQYSRACVVHSAAMGINKMRSIASKIEAYMNAGKTTKAISLYKSAPGILYRNIDRLLRLGNGSEALVIDAIQATVDKVPARLLFAIREHLQNRTYASTSKRIFTNTKGKTWVTADNRKALPSETVKTVLDVIDTELASRLPDLPKVIVDPDMLGVALPKSNKDMENGYGIMPRGSVVPVCVNGERLRFFMYWKENGYRTDYDLSVLFLDSNFNSTGHASYTNLRGDGYKHSGDITSAHNGASEFIEIDLSTINADYIVPQVNVFAGESFSEVEESFFGYMERNPKQKGLPYEPATVRTKGEIRGVGKIALPMVFGKQKDGSWAAFWMNMYLNGTPNFNRVESNKLSTTMLAKAIVSREYLYVSYIVELLMKKNIEIAGIDTEFAEDEPVVYIGLNAPETLPEGSTTYTLTNLYEIVDLFEK